MGQLLVKDPELERELHSSADEVDCNLLVQLSVAELFNDVQELESGLIIDMGSSMSFEL